ncbi:hypothetical protein BGZ68_001480 [Mortierella alpina]|nr:hypothetical protein BGZ68_001480 [Mortierella alpina]
MWSRNGRSLRCGWLDADNTAANSAYFININGGVMGQEGIVHREGKNLCGLGVGVASGGSRARKRALDGHEDDHKKSFGNRARVHSTLSAIDLCDKGDPLYSIKEGVFYDMSTKTKYKLCDGNRTGTCFAYESNETNLKRDAASKIVLMNPRAISIATPQEFIAEYFTIADLNGTVIDDGMSI